MNAELQRNLWLELTLHRLLALPIGLALIFMLAYALANEDPRGAISATAGSLFAALALWGAVHVGDAVMGEARGRTWDGQRMSAIEPWAMTWGKLVGAAAFAWCGGLICLAVFLVFSPIGNTLKMAVFMFSGAVLVQSIALIGSVIASRKAVVRGSSTAWVLGIVLFFVVPWMSILGSGETDVAWWGRSWQRIDFLMGSTAVFAAWGVFGAHRLMCQELRVRTLPWAWVAFLLFAGVYISGFGIRPNDTASQQRTVMLIAGLIVSLAALYPLLLAESGGVMAVRRLLLRGSSRQWRRLLEEIPLWVMSLALAFVFCLATFLLAGGRADSNEIFRAAVLAPVPLFLLAARDAALCLFFGFARQPRRAEAAALFYLLLLYWLVPMLLRAMGAKGVADLVLPPFWERPGFAAMVAAVQAAAMIAAAVWRWRRNYGSQKGG